MRWTLAFFLCIAFGAVAYGDTPASIQTHVVPPAAQSITPQILMPVVPVQPMPATVVVPSVLQVQTLQPQLSLRWGLFRRRLVPQYRYTLGPTLTYGLMTQPSFRQAQ